MIRRPLRFAYHQVKQQKILVLARARDAIVGSIIVPVFYRRGLQLRRGEAARVSNGRLPRILLLRYKYNFGKEECGVSTEESMVAVPLKASNVAEVAEYFYDLEYSGGLFGDRKLIDKVIEFHPDLMVLSSYSHRNRKMPSISALRAVRQIGGVPVLMDWGDSMGPKSVEDCYHMMGAIDLNVMKDSGNLARHFVGDLRYMRMWTAFDFSLFHPGSGQRDIDVSFVGYTLGYRNLREEFLQHLQRHQTGVYVGGGRGEDRLEPGEYADIMRRSKISLNFSHSIPGVHQLKGRVFQVMYSGALLLESDNPETSQYFTPMVDYVPFDSKEDLLDKCRYYLEHDQEREEIAYNGYLKATTKYNHKVYWDTIMERVKELQLL